MKETEKSSKSQIETLKHIQKKGKLLLDNNYNYL